VHVPAGTCHRADTFSSLLLYPVQPQHFEDSDTFSACWVILCFHNPSYRIFNVCVIFLHVYSLIQMTFCRVCTKFDSEEISRGEILGWVQSLAHNCHPSMWLPHLVMLSLACQSSAIALHHQLYLDTDMSVYIKKYDFYTL